MRRGELTVNVALHYAPLVVVLLFALALQAISTPEPFVLVSVVLFAAGLVLLFRAKMSLFRRGVLVSWGPARLSRESRRLYTIGYGLIAAGIVLCLALLFVLRQV